MNFPDLVGFRVVDVQGAMIIMVWAPGVPGDGCFSPGGSTCRILSLPARDLPVNYLDQFTTSAPLFVCCDEFHVKGFTTVDPLHGL